MRAKLAKMEANEALLMKMIKDMRVDANKRVKAAKVTQRAVDKAEVSVIATKAAKRIVEERKTFHSTVLNAMRTAETVGYQRGRVRAIEEIINASFRVIATKYKKDLPKWEGALTLVEEEIKEVEAYILTGDVRGDSDKENAAIMDMVRNIFGQRRFLEVRGIIKDNPGVGLSKIKSVLERHQKSFYSAAITRTVKSVDPDSLYNDTDREGFDFRDQWLRLTSEVTALQKDRLNLKKQLDSEKRSLSPVAIERLKARIDAKTEMIERKLKGNNVDEGRDLHRALLSLKAQSAHIQQELFAGTKLRRFELFGAVAEEVKARLPELSENAKSRGTGAFDLRGDQESWALTMGGGREDSVAYRVIYDEMRKAQVASKTQVSEAHRRMRRLFISLNMSESDTDAWRTDFKEFTFHKFTHKFTVAQIMDAYNLMKDPNAARKLRLNGGKSTYVDKDKVAFGRYIVGRGTKSGEESPFDVLIKTLTPKQKRVADEMFDISNEAAEGGNKTALKILGREKFFNDSHWSMSVALLSETGKQLDSIASLEAGYGPKQLTALKMLAERVPHGNPLYVRDIFDAWNESYQKMADFTHQTVASMDAISVLRDAKSGGGGVKTVMAERLGSRFGKRVAETIERSIGLRKHSDNWGWLRKFWANAHRRAATSLLALRPTSITNNLVGGGMLMANELNKLGGVKLSGAFVAGMPVNLATFFKSGENVRIKDRLQSNGYLYDRWEIDPTRTYTNSPTVHDTVGEGGRTLHSKYAKLERKMATVRQAALKPMAWAERANAIVAFSVLTKNGYSEEAALNMVERMIRRTQNPSSALEETGIYTVTRQTPELGIMLPFFGQPSVSANILSKDLQRWAGAKTSEEKATAMKALLGDMMALVGNNLFSGMQQGFVMAGGYGILSGIGGDDEEALVKRMATGRVFSEFFDNFLPGMGDIFGDAAGEIASRAMYGEELEVWNAFTANVVGRKSEFYSPSIIWQPFMSAVISGPDRIVAGMNNDDMSHLARGVFDVVDGVGRIYGLPTGGAVQVLKAGLQTQVPLKPSRRGEALERRAAREKAAEAARNRYK